MCKWSWSITDCWSLPTSSCTDRKKQRVDVGNQTSMDAMQFPKLHETVPRGHRHLTQTLHPDRIMAGSLRHLRKNIPKRNTECLFQRQHQEPCYCRVWCFMTIYSNSTHRILTLVIFHTLVLSQALKLLIMQHYTDNQVPQWHFLHINAFWKQMSTRICVNFANTAVQCNTLSTVTSVFRMKANM